MRRGDFRLVLGGVSVVAVASPLVLAFGGPDVAAFWHIAPMAAWLGLLFWSNRGGGLQERMEDQRMIPLFRRLIWQGFFPLIAPYLIYKTTPAGVVLAVAAVAVAWSWVRIGRFQKELDRLFEDDLRV